MKKILKFVLVPIMLLACTFMISACKKADGITIHTEFKTEYYVGEMLDVTGGIISYTNEGKTMEVVVKSNMVDGFSSATAGTRNMVITYEGYTTIVSYTIREIPEFIVNYNTIYRAVVTEGDKTGFVYLKFFNNNQIGMLSSEIDFAKNQVEFTSDNKVNYTKIFENGEWVVNCDNGHAVEYEIFNIEANSLTLTVYGQGIQQTVLFYAMQ